jgi:hypothetical protein
MKVNMMDGITEYLPFLIPIIAIELILAVIAIIHVLRHDSYRFGNRAMWVVIVLFIGIIGPVLYFTIGRGDD